MGKGRENSRKYGMHTNLTLTAAVSQWEAKGVNSKELLVSTAQRAYNINITLLVTLINVHQRCGIN